MVVPSPAIALFFRNFLRVNNIGHLCVSNIIVVPKRYPKGAQRVAQLVKAIRRAIAQEEEETDAPSSESERP